jgi:hypothetical protein
VLVEPRSVAEADVDRAAGTPAPDQNTAPQGETGTATTPRGDRS